MLWVVCGLLVPESYAEEAKGLLTQDFSQELEQQFGASEVAQIVVVVIYSHIHKENVPLIWFFTAWFSTLFL